MSFHSAYQAIYPNDLHLKHELRYYLSKVRVVNNVLKYIKESGKKRIKVCDIDWGYGYDDLLIRKLAHESMPDVKIDIDVLDPTVDFYNTIHHLDDSDIGKQSEINYILESFLTFDTKANHEKYDIILCCEVIEHLRTSEQEVFFSNFNRILKPGGLVALTVPNGSNTFKQLFGLYTRSRKQNHIFEAEFNYRYSHIGVPTIFQVLGLFQRKWFQVQDVYGTTFLSSTKTNRLQIILHKIFDLFCYINLFFSTDAVYIAKKEHKLDDKMWHNDSTIVLDNETALDTSTLKL